MELIKAEEAKRIADVKIADVNNREYKDEIEILNILIKEAMDCGSRTCGVNIRLIPSVIEELEKAGYIVYDIHPFGRKTEEEEIYYVLKW